LNVRLALGVLLVLGLADLALLNLHLAPQLAMQQAPVPTETARTSHVPNVPTVPSAPASTGTALQVAPLPTASVVAVASAAPTNAVASVAVKEPPVAAPPVTAAPVAPPVPVPPPAPSRPSSPGEPIADVNFELSSFQITYLPSIVALKRVAEELRNDPSRKVLLRGHTDQMGPDSYKHALSQRRAVTVQMFLFSHGAPLDQITIEAVGDSEPIDPENNPVAWAKNRRVQVLWR
jgi:outer membrane protein OmpA-like peptidoglycan-associated protein